MCSCSVGRVPYNSISVDKILQDQQLRQTIMARTIISQEGFTNRDPESVFLFLFCVSPEKFRQAFKQYDLSAVNNEEVKALAQIHKTGKDRELFKVDFMDVVGKIKLSANELQNAKCSVEFMGA